MLSVVIPAFNEEVQLGECLESLARQEISEPFEVIVVDNNSADGTERIARQFERRLNLVVIYEPRQGRGQARQTGCRAARGDIFFSTDADAAVPPQWLEVMARSLRSGDYVAVAGPSRLKDDCSRRTQQCFNWFQPRLARAYHFLFRHYWLPGFNFAIWREIYFRAGEFDADMDALEDNDLSWRVKKIGKIGFVSMVPAVISGRRFLRGFWWGIVEYVVTFIKYHWLKNRRIRWSNIR